MGSSPVMLGVQIPMSTGKPDGDSSKPNGSITPRARCLAPCQSTHGIRTNVHFIRDEDDNILDFEIEIARPCNIHEIDNVSRTAAANIHPPPPAADSPLDPVSNFLLATSERTPREPASSITEPSKKRLKTRAETLQGLSKSSAFVYLDRCFWPCFWLGLYESNRIVPTAIKDQMDHLQAVLHSSGVPKNQDANGFAKKTANCIVPDSYLSHGSAGTSPSPLHQNLGRLFDKYRDQPAASPDKILINGIQNYMNDLNVAPDEVVSLALFDITSCRVFGEIERSPFIGGWSSQPGSPDTKDKQKARIDALRKELAKNRQLFTKVYRFSFNLLKPDGQRNIPVESAMDVWKMFFTSGKKGREGGMQWKTSGTDWLSWWLEFYGSKVNRPVNKDLWNMVAELAFKTMESGGENLGWWSEDAAWPGAIDEFVQWARERKGLPLVGVGDGEQGDSMDMT